MVHRGTSPNCSLKVSTIGYTESAIVHLARALVVNPEVLVVHRPAIHFDGKLGKLVMALLREHVDQRGLALDEAGWARRRPRTLIYSTDYKQRAMVADEIWYIKHGTATVWDGVSELHFTVDTSPRSPRSPRRSKGEKPREAHGGEKRGEGGRVGHQVRISLQKVLDT